MTFWDPQITFLQETMLQVPVKKFFCFNKLNIFVQLLYSKICADEET
jgi:hypothetical protein